MISKFLFGTVLTFCCVVQQGDGDAQPSAEIGSEAKIEIPAEEKPFRDSAQQFVDAYAKRDVAAIGMLFTENAEFRDEFGEITVGRVAIAELFQNVFASAPEAVIEAIDIERIRYITSTCVLEEGQVSARDVADGPIFTNQYVALHVKGDDGVWRINTVKDYPRNALGKNEYLDQLTWLVGDWINEDADVLVKTSCKWSDDGNYLLRQYELETPSGKGLTGVERIGWDPLRKQLRSWTFDSAGGFVESYWTRNEDQWIVTSQGTTADGQPIHATATYNAVDPERIVWTISNLAIGSEQSGPESVIMMRAAPKPKTAE